MPISITIWIFDFGHKKFANHQSSLRIWLRQLAAGGATQTRTGDKGFADLCLTTWLWRHWSGRRDSNSRHPPWQGGTLPLSYYRKWCLGAESNHRHVDFQSTALPTELPRHAGDPEGARTLDLQRDRLAF